MNDKKLVHFKKVNKKRNNTFLIFGVASILLVTLLLTSFALFQNEKTYPIVEGNYISGACDYEVGYTWDFPYNGTDGTDGSAQEFPVPCDGTYKIELWGAQGGMQVGNLYNLGAYTSGEITLNNDEMLYIYVGGQGYPKNSGGKGGYNGGGQAYVLGSSSGSSGGGATDVRLNVNDTKAWDDFQSLKSRIMVAAGAGGGFKVITSGYGGAGGGLVGYAGADIDEPQYSDSQGQGGTQTEGGPIPIPYQGSLNGGVGTFGQGGYGGYNSACHGEGGGSGGGGGYYGGSGASGLCNGIWYGGGGSSYISGHFGAMAIDNSSTSINQITYQLNSYHYSGKYFINTEMIDGAGYKWSTKKDEYVGQVQPDGTIAKGHTGNGYARITYIGKTTSNDSSYNCNTSHTWEFAYNGSNNLNGSVQEFKVPCDGIYQLEAWGAQGGGENNSYNLGGYTSGKINFNRNDVLYMYIGGQGIDANKTGIGGYNGGGGSSVCRNNSGSTGGGATDIRLEISEDKLWSNTDSLNSRIMVAGGGGGGYQSYGAGGAAGGLTGYAGSNFNNSYAAYQGKGGTQTDGGAIPTLYSGASNGTAGSLGKGGIGGYNQSCGASGGSGGGGGYYGGSGSSGLSSGTWFGGGGSSFISGHSGCATIEGHVFRETTVIDGEGKYWTSSVGTYSGQIQPDGTLAKGHSGHGYVRITYIND